MGLPYNPGDAKRTNLLRDGEYEAVIQSVVRVDAAGEPLVSKTSGEPMEYLEIEVQVENGTRLMRYYITETWRAMHYQKFAKALGADAVERFDAGSFDPAEHLGSNIRVTIKTKGDRNNIDKVLPSKYVTPSMPSPPPKTSIDMKLNKSGGPKLGAEDIPF